MKKLLYLFLIFVLLSCSNNNDKHGWTLLLKQQGKADIEILQFHDISKPLNFQKSIDGIDISFSLVPGEKFSIYKAVAKLNNDTASVFFSLRKYFKSNEKPFNFDGEVKSDEIFRQSPHDVNAWITNDIAKQAVPVVSVYDGAAFNTVVCSSPAFYNNFTTQAFYLSESYVEISSGDDGNTPGLSPDKAKNKKIDYNTDKTQIMAPGKILAHYHKIDKNIDHQFDGIIFKSEAIDFKGLRKDINQKAAIHFSDGKYTDYFGALSFTTAYMNLRNNETQKSEYWVVPSVEYANTQYCRDAFWISTILEPQFSAECLKSELETVNSYAEYPLIAVIWAYRAFKEGKKLDLNKVQAYVDEIESRVRNDWFYSYTEKDGRLDFQYWGDVIAFEKDDVIAYNQGLLALVTRAAIEMGLKIHTDPVKALSNYKSMYNKGLGFYPISKKKDNILGPDPIVPDLLGQIYFGFKMLDSDKVTSHYNKIIKNSKTDFGFKVVSLPDGNYLPDSLYDVTGYISQVNREKMPNGRYFKGGSYFLYDNLFLIDAYLHGIKEAENELIWRVSLDFEIGATTYECLNTKTGEPWKPNMGWNVAIYSFWRNLADLGKVSNKLFDEVDKIVENK